MRQLLSRDGCYAVVNPKTQSDYTYNTYNIDYHHQYHSSLTLSIPLSTSSEQQRQALACCCCCYYYTRLMASFPGQPGLSWYQKGKTSLDLNKARDYGVLGWQWHHLDHMQTICTSFQTDKQTNTSSLNFYWPDALPDTQPTVSKH